MRIRWNAWGAKIQNVAPGMRRKIRFSVGKTHAK